MIRRDLLRWALNLLVGPPLGFIVCVVAMMLLLVFAQPGEWNSRVDGAMIFAVFAVPFIVLSHVLGFLPGLLTSIAGSILDRILRTSRGVRLLAMLVAGAAATWAGDWWLLGGNYSIQVGSQDLFVASIVIGGAGSALICAAVVEAIFPMPTVAAVAT